MTALGINGFGRIGRNVFRAGQGRHGFEVKGINDLANATTLAHLLQYDSNYGPFAGEVYTEGDFLVVNGQRIQVSAERDPAQLPWKALGVEVALECTGIFTDAKGGQKHLQAGAKKTLFSAPAKGDEVLTVVKGVNFNLYDKARHHLVSNASCTTNCLAPLAKVLHQNFGIVSGLMTTVHAYTNDQPILDQPHLDLRRARAGALSLIPTSTGAAKAIGLVMPELKGRFDGLAVRAPTATVSVVDLTVNLEKSATAKQANAALQAAANGELKGIMAYTTLPLVSIDFKGNPHSSIVDSLTTTSISGNLLKVLSWYDNEWGYSNRMVDVALNLL